MPRQTPTPAQPQPGSLERRTYLALVQAHEAQQAVFARAFKQAGLTDAQFNALRILARGPEQGSTCHEIGDQLMTRVPDVTRLLDRLEKAELVTRERSTADRRVVLVRITVLGRERVESLEEPLRLLHAMQLAHLSREDVTTLDRLLRTLFVER